MFPRQTKRIETGLGGVVVVVEERVWERVLAAMFDSLYTLVAAGQSKGFDGTTSPYQDLSLRLRWVGIENGVSQCA